MPYFNLKLSERDGEMLVEVARYRQTSKSAVMRKAIRSMWLAVQRQKQADQRKAEDDDGQAG